MDDFEIEHGHDDYELDELLEQAQANAQAFLLANVAYLRQSGAPLTAWAEAIGARFAMGWGDPRPWDAGEFLDAMLTNYRAFGAEVRDVDLAVDHAEAVIGPFPDPELCAFLGLPPDAADPFHDVPAAIAAPRALSWSWSRSGEEVRLQVDKHDS